MNSLLLSVSIPLKRYDSSQNEMTPTINIYEMIRHEYIYLPLGK